MSRNISGPMGELLLKGWCMLAESCPACSIPLMRDPQSRERKCILCQTLYPATGDLQGPEVQAVGQAEASAAAQAAGEPEDGGSSDAAADASGDRNGDDAPWRSSHRESDQAAELLSAKMLQGWALLETSCPRCSTPLVRNREKRMMCVMCQAWVVSEADAAKAATEQKPTVSEAPEAAPLPSPVGRDASVTLPLPPVLGKPVLGTTRPLPSPDGAAGTVLGSPVPSSRAFREQQQQQQQPAAAGPASFSPSPQLLSVLAASLEEKLWQAQRLLAATPASSTDEVRGYLSVVSECMDAMAKVRLEARHQQL